MDKTNSTNRRQFKWRKSHNFAFPVNLPDEESFSRVRMVDFVETGIIHA